MNNILSFLLMCLIVLQFSACSNRKIIIDEYLFKPKEVVKLSEVEAILKETQVDKLPGLWKALGIQSFDLEYFMNWKEPIQSSAGNGGSAYELLGFKIINKGRFDILMFTAVMPLYSSYAFVFEDGILLGSIQFNNKYGEEDIKVQEKDDGKINIFGVIGTGGTGIRQDSYLVYRLDKNNIKKVLQVKKLLYSHSYIYDVRTDSNLNYNSKEDIINITSKTKYEFRLASDSKVHELFEIDKNIVFKWDDNTKKYVSPDSEEERDAELYPHQAYFLTHFDKKIAELEKSGDKYQKEYIKQQKEDERKLRDPK